MLETTKLSLFLITALVLLITPGPAVLYIIARSVDQGRVAGVVSALGVGLGTTFHVAAAALEFSPGQAGFPGEQLAAGFAGELGGLVVVGVHRIWNLSYIFLRILEIK